MLSSQRLTIDKESGSSSQNESESSPSPSVEQPNVDQLSMREVLSQCSDFVNVKSMIERALNARGHVALLSSKFHVECAGVGIEHDFGRAKWWFRKHNRLSTESLRKLSTQAFGVDVISLYHTRKFARKTRDYMRAHRAGSKGLETDSVVTVCKSHRCVLHTHIAFVISDDTD